MVTPGIPIAKAGPPPPPQERQHTTGEVVHFHRRGISPGVRRGVVLSSGSTGLRVRDTGDGSDHEVLHEGVYRHATVHAGDLASAIVSLTSLGIPVSLTESQTRALKRGHRN